MLIRLFSEIIMDDEEENVGIGLMDLPDIPFEMILDMISFQDQKRLRLVSNG